MRFFKILVNNLKVINTISKAFQVFNAFLLKKNLKRIFHKIF